MRDSLLNIFPFIDVIKTTDKQKHWGFLNYSINPLISFTNEEINKLENIIKKTNNKELKAELTKLLEKLQAIHSKSNLSDNTNIELLMRSQGYAVTQAPQYKINSAILEEVKNALMQNKKLEGKYHNKKRILEPLGLIYGTKTYLIALERKKGNEIYTYTLHKFENLKMIQEIFKKQNFDLQEFANRSFGIYQGEILDVELEFNKESIAKAINYHFHPTQKIKKLKNGNLIVNFRASGEREIIYHVFRWGENCKINKPEKLKEAYKAYLKNVLKNY